MSIALCPEIYLHLQCLPLVLKSLQKNVIVMFEVSLIQGLRKASLVLHFSTFGLDPIIIKVDVVKCRVQIGALRFVARFLVHDQVNSKIHCPGLFKVYETLKERGVCMADTNVNADILTNIEMLIRVDYFSKLILNQCRICGVNTFIFLAGVIPFVPLPKWSKPVVNQNQFHPIICDKKICNPPRETSMRDLEVIGIKDERFTYSEQVAVSQVMHDMCKTPEGYEVQLPFVSENRPSVNFRTACVQMNSLVNKFQSDV